MLAPILVLCLRRLGTLLDRAGRLRVVGVQIRQDRLLAGEDLSPAISAGMLCTPVAASSSVRSSRATGHRTREE
jgi:hypothetical protein